MPEITLYKDNKLKFIDPDLFARVAEGAAKEVVSQKRGNKNSFTQIRKFYDEMLRLRELSKSLQHMESDAEDWRYILPRVRMLSAKAAYAEARDKVSKEFSSMICSLVTQVNEQDDLEIATTFFEAFIGYYKLLENSRGQNR